MQGGHQFHFPDERASECGMLVIAEIEEDDDARVTPVARLVAFSCE